MSQWLALTLAMGAACAVVLAIVFINHRRVGDDDDPSETPDVIEYMTMMIGVVYAIVIGLAIAGVWEGRGAAQESVRQEAQALHEVRVRSEAWPQDVHERISADVDAYVRQITGPEWRTMADTGELTDKGAQLLLELRRTVTEYRPADEYEAEAYQPMVDQVAAADDARSARADAAGETMPGVVWFGLITGAIIAVGLIFTLQIRRTSRELLLAGLYSALIAFLLFLIWSIDAPFGRGVAATTEPFQALFPGVAS
ncbi:DUF4239 domain-containing protein [Streptomyces sp. MUM 203J]|uniref:bestrophin-like domain n=1 Tax=Streptomyces sp. MUM 203J TaxID=2791990 RepID=UPI001F034BBD|nr:DUF4239 domain-containing protein [Streptomyces sp. MUM 203J]MCH0539743.1 DUF4239 domain-containing protein [Streptomyces sp. MUM 203J]